MHFRNTYLKYLYLVQALNYSKIAAQDVTYGPIHLVYLLIYII